MEQANQEINQKPSLPIRTKIAAWWMIIFGIISLGYQVSILYPHYKIGKEYGGSGFIFLGAFFPILFNTLIFILPSIFLIKRRKAAWNFAVAILIFVITTGLFTLGISIFQEGFNFTGKLTTIFCLLLIFPFIFLILDRKNFFKIAS